MFDASAVAILVVLAFTAGLGMGAWLVMGLAGDGE